MIFAFASTFVTLAIDDGERELLFREVGLVEKRRDLVGDLRSVRIVRDAGRRLGGIREKGLRVLEREELVACSRSGTFDLLRVADEQALDFGVDPRVVAFHVRSGVRGTTREGRQDASEEDDERKRGSHLE